MSRRNTALDLLGQADEKWLHLRTLRRFLVEVLAVLGALLWIAALWPEKFARAGVIVTWPFGIAASLTFVVGILEIAAWLRFRRLIDVRGPND